jgi:hypothetical protein
VSLVGRVNLEGRTPDSVRRVPNKDAIKRFRSVGHNTFIGENGGIEIEVVQTKKVIFSKAGEDGRKVHEV